MDRRTLLLGDWHPLIRDGIDLLRLGVLGGAVAFTLAGEVKGAVVLGLLGTVTLLARLVNLPRVYDLSLTVRWRCRASARPSACTTASSVGVTQQRRSSGSEGSGRRRGLRPPRSRAGPAPVDVLAPPPGSAPPATSPGHRP